MTTPAMFAKETVRDPAIDLVAVTKSDSDTFRATNGVYVGTGGDLAVTPAGPTGANGPVILKNVAGGVVLPIAVIQILSTSTTASDFVLLY